MTLKYFYYMRGQRNWAVVPRISFVTLFEDGGDEPGFFNLAGIRPAEKDLSHRIVMGRLSVVLQLLRILAGISPSDVAA